MPVDWASPEGLAELERLHGLATSVSHPGQRHHPDRHVHEAGYAATAWEATPALAAEIRRLREREAVLVGLLHEVAKIANDEIHSAAACRVALKELAPSINAALTPGGNDGR